MLNVTEIENGDIRILTPRAVLALSNLVKRSTAFKNAGLYYLDINTKVQGTVTAAHAQDPSVLSAGSVAAADAAAIAAGAAPADLALAKALAAVGTKLATLPGIAVESEGTEKARSFFSAENNWNELALDIISTLYDTPPVVAQGFGVATRRIAERCGLEWIYGDELRFSMRGPIYLDPLGWGRWGW
jgi:hypothetical protein